MSFDTARVSVMTKVLAVLTTFDATIVSQFENQESIDMNVSQFAVEVRMPYKGSEQVSLGTNPRTRYHGELQLYIKCKRGLGTKRSGEIAEAMARGIEYQKLGAVQLHAPRLLEGRPAGDWYILPLMTSFYTDVI